MSASYNFQAHLQHSQRCCFSQTTLQWFTELNGFSLALPGFSPALPDTPRHVIGAPRIVAGSPRWSQTYHNHSPGTPVPVIKDPSNCEVRPECPPMVWHSSEIDTSKCTLHILSDNAGGSHWFNFISLMKPAAEALIDEKLQSEHLTPCWLVTMMYGTSQPARMMSTKNLYFEVEF